MPRPSRSQGVVATQSSLAVGAGAGAAGPRHPLWGTAPWGLRGTRRAHRSLCPCVPGFTFGSDSGKKRWDRPRGHMEVAPSSLHGARPHPGPSQDTGGSRDSLLTHGFWGRRRAGVVPPQLSGAPHTVLTRTVSAQRGPAVASPPRSAQAPGLCTPRRTSGRLQALGPPSLWGFDTCSSDCRTGFSGTGRGGGHGTAGQPAPSLQESKVRPGAPRRAATGRPGHAPRPFLGSARLLPALPLLQGAGDKPSGTRVHFEAVLRGPGPSFPCMNILSHQHGHPASL